MVFKAHFYKEFPDYPSVDEQNDEKEQIQKDFLWEWNYSEEVSIVDQANLGTSVYTEWPRELYECTNVRMYECRESKNNYGITTAHNRSPHNP